MKKILLNSLLFCFSIVFGQNLQISGGNNFSAAVCDNQIVYTWGSNASGQLGIDETGTPYPQATSTVPLPVGKNLLPTFRQIDAGSGAHILALDCNKQVWAWGEGTCGQIGQGGATPAASCYTATVANPQPKRVLRGAQAQKNDAAGNDPTGLYLHDIIYVSGGNNTSFAVETTQGRVLAWGENGSGQLGDGTTTNRTLPVYVIQQNGTPLTNIIQIEGGDDCTYALDAAGNVWSWGINAGAELGRVAASGTAAAWRAGQVQIDANFDNAPDGTLGGITQISGGDTHGLGLTAAGAVWSWGGDWGPGQRGLGPGYQGYTGFECAYRVISPAIATPTDQSYRNGPYIANGTYVAAGQASSAVVLATGEVVTFGAQGFFTGASTDFPCNDPDPNNDPQYTLRSGTLGNCGGATTANGACHNFTTPQPQPINTAEGSSYPIYVMTATGRLNNVVSVSDGDAWYFALRRDGTAVAWGWNRRGELGLGGTNKTDQPCAVPFPLPSGCSLDVDCPGTANVTPASVNVVCNPPAQNLNSNVPKDVTSYTYTWYTRATNSDSWTLVSGATNPTYTTPAGVGQYKVVVSDSRTTVAKLCGPCPISQDSMTITCFLPLDFVQFNAERQGHRVHIHWNMAHEENTKYYSVQRSLDGVNYTEIGQVQLSNSGHSHNDYSFIDKIDTHEGNAYYQILRYDLQGVSSATSIISVDLKGYNSTVAVTPNPNNGSFKISLNKNVTNLNVRIVNLRGVDVYNGNFSNSSADIDLTHMSKGIYFVYVSDGIEKWIEKIVVE